MFVSTSLLRASLIFIFVSFFVFQSQAQEYVNNELTPFFTKNASAERDWSIHVTPSKYLCGEMPVVVSKQIANALVVEAGVGPTFRDRIAEKMFNGKFGNLEFIDNASYKLGYGVYAGVRYLPMRDVFTGFYVNPELSYQYRTISYPANENDLYQGSQNSMNVRVLLGYDRTWSDYSEHFFYGGYFGFGMRRYQADYFVKNVDDPGVRKMAVATPTMHLGYRVGWKF